MPQHSKRTLVRAPTHRYCKRWYFTVAGVDGLWVADEKLSQIAVAVARGRVEKMRGVTFTHEAPSNLRHKQWNMTLCIAKLGGQLDVPPQTR